MGNYTHKHTLETTISIIGKKNRRTYIVRSLGVVLVMVLVAVLVLQTNESPNPKVPPAHEEEAVKVEEPAKLTEDQVRNNEAYRTTEGTNNGNVPALLGVGE